METPYPIATPYLKGGDKLEPTRVKKMSRKPKTIWENVIFKLPTK